MNELFAVLILIAAGLGVIAVIAAIVNRLVEVVTIYDYQAGLLYRGGVFVETLKPGRHWLFRPTMKVFVEDAREQLLVLPGQEILTDDNLTVKVSLTVRYRTLDARKKHESAGDVLELVYNDLQIALRQAVASRSLEQLLGDRNALVDEIAGTITETALTRGLEIIAIDVRDVMLTGEAKRAYADIFRARKEGEAALERARGETAALRNLANGARLLKGNRDLFNLRLLQTLSTSATKGATVVINTTGEAIGGSDGEIIANDGGGD